MCGVVAEWEITVQGLGSFIENELLILRKRTRFSSRRVGLQALF